MQKLEKGIHLSMQTLREKFSCMHITYKVSALDPQN